MATDEGSMRIRVHPDTKTFKSELQRDLEAIEQFYKSNPLQIAAELDSTDLSDFQRQLKALDKVAGEVAESVKKIKFDGNTEADKKAKEALEAQKKAAEEFQKVLKSSTSYASKLASELGKDFQTRNIISVDADTSHLEASLRHAVRDSADYARKEFGRIGFDGSLGSLTKVARTKLGNLVQHVKLSIDYGDLDRMHAEVQRTLRDVEARFNRIQTRTILVKAAIDRSSFYQVGQGLLGLETSLNALRAIRDLAANADKIAPGIARGVTQATLLGTALLGAVGASARLIVDLASIARMAGLMGPALLGAVGALWPVMRKFKEELKGAFSGMNTDIGDSITKGLQQVDVAGQAKQMGDRMGSALSGVFRALSVEFGDMMTNAMRRISSPVGLSQMTSFLSNLKAGLYEAKTALGSLAAAIMTLAEAGSKYFPAMGRAFADSMHKFDFWTKRITQDGSFDRWVREGYQALKDLISVLGSAGSIFSSVANAAKAAGIGGLHEFAKGLRAISDALKTDAWQVTLMTYFNGVSRAVDQLKPGLADLLKGFQDFAPAFQRMAELGGKAFGTLLGTIGDLMSHPAVQGGLVTLLGNVNNALSMIRDASGPLGNVLGKLMELFGALTENAAEVGTMLLTKFEPALVAIMDAAIAVLPSISEIAVVIADTLAPAIIWAAEQIRNFAQENPKLAATLGILILALNPLAKAFGVLVSAVRVVSAIFRGINTVFQAVGRALSWARPFVDDIGRAFKGLGDKAAPLTNVIRNLIGPNAFGRIAGVLGKAAGAIGIVITLFKGMWDNSEALRNEVSELASTIGEILSPILDGLKESFLGNNENMKEFGAAFQTVMDVMGQSLGFFGDVIALLTNGLGGALKILSSLLQGDFSGAWDAAREAISDFIDIGADIINTVADILDTLGLDGLASTLRDTADNWTLMGEAAKTALNSLDWETVKTKLLEFGATMLEAPITWWNNMLTGLGTWWTNLTTWFDEKKLAVWSKVVEWGLNLLNAPLEWWNSLVTGLGTWWNNIITWFAEKGPEIWNKVVEWGLNLLNAPLEWWNSLVTGLGTWWNNIITWFAEKGPEIWNKVVEWGLNLLNAPLEWWNNLLVGLGTWWTNLTAWFDEKKTAVWEKVKDWGSNLVEVGTEWWNSLLEGLGTLWESLTGWLDEKKQGIKDKITEWGGGLSEGITSWKPSVDGGLGGVWERFTGWFGEKKSQTGSKVGEWSSSVADGIRGWAGSTLGAAGSWWSVLSGNLDSRKGAVKGKGSDYGMNMSGGMRSQIGQITAVAQMWVNNLIMRLLSGISRAATAAMQIAAGFKGPLQALASSISSVGMSIASGLAAGIRAGASAVISAASDIAGRAIAAAKAVLKINSPSKVFMAIGQGIPEGMVIGVNRGTGSAVRSVESMAHQMVAVGNRQLNFSRGLVANVSTARVGATKPGASGTPVAIGGESHYHVHMHTEFDESRAMRRGAEELGRMLNSIVPVGI